MIFNAVVRRPGHVGEIEVEVLARVLVGQGLVAGARIRAAGGDADATGDRVIHAEVGIEARADAVALAIAVHVLHVERSRSGNAGRPRTTVRERCLRHHVGGLVGGGLGFRRRSSSSVSALSRAASILAESAASCAFSASISAPCANAGAGARPAAAASTAAARPVKSICVSWLFSEFLDDLS